LTVYYNENDAFCASWLRELIKRGLIAPGDVDERDIRDVRPSELVGYTQHHWFAGIGTWSYALRRAGWSDDRSVWTASCPCQPFSAIGRREGFADERHLWPTLFHLVEECRPGTLFGEQVGSKDGLAWLDLVRADVEGAAYAFAPFNLAACGVGAPHIRQRMYFVADRDFSGGMGDPYDAGLEGHSGGDQAESRHGQGEARPTAAAGEPGHSIYFPGLTDAGPVNGFWADADWRACKDGKWRPTEPGAQPLVDRTPNRMGLLRAYGNAIVAPLATEFIKSYMDTISRKAPS
jgi:DNA (cytosine-5)-methyltransferase 1